MEPWRYGCTIGFLMYSDKPLGGVISQPQRHPVEGIRNLYRFLMAGFAWFYRACTTGTSHTPASCLQGRSKDFADYVSRRSNACRVVLRSARVLDVRWKRRLARSPTPSGTPSRSTRVLNGRTRVAIRVLGSPRKWIAVNNSTDIGFNTNQQPKEIICEDQK
jgi:hypothetical protein